MQPDKRETSIVKRRSCFQVFINNTLSSFDKQSSLLLHRLDMLIKVSPLPSAFLLQTHCEFHYCIHCFCDKVLSCFAYIRNSYRSRAVHKDRCLHITNSFTPKDWSWNEIVLHTSSISAVFSFHCNCATFF